MLSTAHSSVQQQHSWTVGASWDTPRAESKEGGGLILLKTIYNSHTSQGITFQRELMQNSSKLWEIIGKENMDPATWFRMVNEGHQTTLLGSHSLNLYKPQYIKGESRTNFLE